tara:strand:+ start:112 stop:768 length:657 start_codon:yes stop_codon:yes gene_type:complete
MVENTKKGQLLSLAKARQQASWPGFANLTDFHDGYYECDVVSPWSLSAGNVGSDVMIVGQDWAASDLLGAPPNSEIKRSGYDPALPTNNNLQRLLHAKLGLRWDEVYATNMMPLIKLGDMGARLPVAAARWAAEHFLLPQVRIVSPLIVICLGRCVGDTLRHVLRLPLAPSFNAMIERPFEVGTSLAYVVPHPGARGTNNRGAKQVELDWDRIAAGMS